MKHRQFDTLPGDRECAGDLERPAQPVVLRVQALQRQIDALDARSPAVDRLSLSLERGYLLLELDRREEAWKLARSALSEALEAELWQEGVQACDILFQCEQPDSLKALAQGIWLGVTFPVDPGLSVAMLQHLVEESPDHSDGAAVAASVAAYIVDLRADGKQREELRFFTSQLLGQVARRHSRVDDQEIFDFWVERLELDDPGRFLPRLSRVLEILVGGDWWFDRDQLRSKIPE